MSLYNKILTITLTLALLVNGAVYMALNDPETQPKPEIIRSACVDNGAFTVLASALKSYKPRKGN